MLSFFLEFCPGVLVFLAAGVKKKPELNLNVMYVVAFLQSLSQVMPTQLAGPDPTRDPPQRPCKSPLGRVQEENVRASLRIRSHLRCRKSFFENLIQNGAFLIQKEAITILKPFQS